MQQRVLACPACDSSRVTRFVAGGPGEQRTGARHRCAACGATFDEPVERAPRHRPRGLAGVLASASADAVGGGG